MSIYTFTITVESPSSTEAPQNIIDQLANISIAKYSLTPTPTTTGTITNIEIVTGE